MICRALLLALLPALPLLADDLPVITIRTPAGQMKYDKPFITASPGSQVKLIFENLDEMPHNFVLCHPHPDKADKGMDVALLAWQLGPLGEQKAWVPDSPRVIAHSGMVPAHGKAELTLKIPGVPGVYPYVCTFPGHAMAMNGELRVITQGPGFSKLDYQLHLGDWDHLPDFTTLTPHRSGPVPDKKISIELEGMTERFGVRYTGVLEAPEDGAYEFHLASDDGARLSIDGKMFIENDGIHPASQIVSKKRRLKKGPHQIQLDYFESAGQEQLYLAWSSAKFSANPLSKWIHPSHNNNPEPKAAVDEFTGIPLAPENGEAIIYRNFITGVSPRGIAVGYPNGVNLCFDADQMSPALFWEGAFIDAKRHWTGRGAGAQPPLGYNLFKPAPAGPSIAILADATTPWPTPKDRAERLRFRGYRLDDKRQPTFKYEMGSITISESYQPAGSTATGDLRVTRTLHFLAPEPVAHLHLRAATGVKSTDGKWTGDGFTITADQATPILRDGELLVPVVFTGDTATTAVTYHWKP